MELLSAILGFAIIALAVVDLLANSLVLNGAGKVTKYISSYTWRLLWTLSKKDARAKLLIYSPVFIIAAMFIYYLVCTWLGVWLIYLGKADSVVNAKTLEHATALQKFYFTGYVLSTMGLGDYQPAGSFYQLVTSAFSLLGLSVMTLFISYIIPASSAGVEKQVLANYIQNLGSTPSLLIKKGYNPDTKSVYKERFEELHKMLLRHTEKHLAYPILHYYHNNAPQTAFVVNIAKLDEVLHILKNSVSREVVDQRNVDLLKQSIDTYLATMKAQSNLFYAAEDPSPPMEKIETQQLPFELSRPPEDIEKEWSERRMDWQRLLRFQGWDYKDVYSDGPVSE